MRKLRIKVFMHLQLHVVETWRAVTDLNMERRRWFHDWKENAEKQMKQRNKIGEFLMCNHLQKRFSCLLYTSPSPRDVEESRMPSSA